jgi:hypothetical protein
VRGVVGSRVLVPRCQVRGSGIVFSMISSPSWQRSLVHQWTTSCAIRREEMVVGSICMRFWQQMGCANIRVQSWKNGFDAERVGVEHFRLNGVPRTTWVGTSAGIWVQRSGTSGLVTVKRWGTLNVQKLDARWSSPALSCRRHCFTKRCRGVVGKTRKRPR